MSLIEYSFPTHVTFGPGARTRLPRLVAAAGCKRPLVVTDAGLAKLPVLTQVTTPLEEEGIAVEIFAGVEGNPVASQVRSGVHAFSGAEADCIVALGGGAALDVAKVIALMAHHPGDLFDYEDGKPDARPVDQPIPAMIAIPTTAGTGSEVGRSAVISDDATKRKRIIFSPRLLPPEVIVDPELTLGLPPKMTAATGMDAISHLVEAYLAPGFQPLCDGIALEGLRLAGRSLVACVEYARQVVDQEVELEPVEQGDHVNMRGLMLNASLMGAIAFQKGLGVTHSCAHSLSAVCDLHHGLANGILLPYAMRFNSSSSAERLRELALAVGACDGQDFADYLAALQKRVGIPSRLGEVGVGLQHLDALVKNACQDVCHASNPRPVTADDFRGLFTEAIG